MWKREEVGERDARDMVMDARSERVWRSDRCAQGEPYSRAERSTYSAFEDASMSSDDEEGSSEEEDKRAETFFSRNIRIP